MRQGIIILIFSGSLLLIFAIGTLIGHLFKLDKYLNDLYNQPHSLK